MLHAASPARWPEPRSSKAQQAAFGVRSALAAAKEPTNRQLQSARLFGRADGRGRAHAPCCRSAAAASHGPPLGVLSYCAVGCLPWLCTPSCGVACCTIAQQWTCSTPVNSAPQAHSSRDATNTVQPALPLLLRSSLCAALATYSRKGSLQQARRRLQLAGCRGARVRPAARRR